MKRFFLFVAMLLCFASIQAQYVNFKLQKEGFFLTEDGTNYTIIDYEGKTAEELYNMVKSNVMSLYKNPQHVMIENKPLGITIRALSNIIYETYKPYGGGFISYQAYYNYIFQFKDGKIKVDAPLVDSKLYTKSVFGAQTYPTSFVSVIEKWYDKNGDVKKKKADNVQEIEAIFNAPINYLLGNKQEDNW